MMVVVSCEKVGYQRSALIFDAITTINVMKLINYRLLLLSRDKRFSNASPFHTFRALGTPCCLQSLKKGAMFNFISLLWIYS